MDGCQFIGSTVFFHELLFFRRNLLAKEREYKKAKSLKKAQRRREMDEITEKEKSKWLDFNAKVSINRCDKYSD